MIDVSLLRSLVDDIVPEVIELRRQLHRRPELGWHEIETTQRIAAMLRAHGVEPRIRESGTGLVTQVGDSGPLVGFRADLDALPIGEETKVPFASEIRGLMHACGHDAHSAVAAGVAIVLDRLPELPGRKRIIWQPAEELIPGGASELVAEGLVDGMAGLVAFHVDPSLPPGQVGFRKGPITGASDRVVIRLTGPGGHTSRPHRTVDLVYAAARVAADLPVLLQRTTDPRHPVILAWGKIEGGSAANVIPSEVELAGTVRLFELDLWHDMASLVERLVHDLVDPLGAHAKVEYERGSPPVVNNAGVIDVAERAAQSVLGREGITGTHQSMGSEDFAWYLEHVPGALLRLGCQPGNRDIDLHSSTFDLDERAISVGMLVGAAVLVGLAEAAAD